MPGFRPARYGPFHRLESPTQTKETARKQQESGQLWGKPPRYGLDVPTVKAYVGPLPNGKRGIEFWTDTKPTNESPVRAYWMEDSPGVFDVEGQSEFVAILGIVTVVSY